MATTAPICGLMAIATMMIAIGARPARIPAMSPAQQQ
jgi:hypothetical protein